MGKEANFREIFEEFAIKFWGNMPEIFMRGFTYFISVFIKIFGL